MSLEPRGLGQLKTRGGRRPVFTELPRSLWLGHVCRQPTGELIRSECSKAARSDACRTMGVRIRTAVRHATLTSAYSSRPQNANRRQAIIHTSIALMYDTYATRTTLHHCLRISPLLLIGSVTSCTSLENFWWSKGMA